MRGLQKKAGSVILNNKTKDLFRERAPLMFVSKIQLEKYKSIIDPVEIHFYPGLPTVLIGKNGSGKTNVLEALEAIALANGSRFSLSGEAEFDFRVFINLLESDLNNLLPDVKYNKNHCELIAYNGQDGLRIDRLQSDYVVPLLKQEIEDVRSLAEKLHSAVETYKRQLTKISHSEQGELPVHCYEVSDYRDSTTNFEFLKWKVSSTIDQIKKTTESLIGHFSNEEDALMFITKGTVFFPYYDDLMFELKYVKPDLAPFEQKFITINETAIKREIARINKATKESCEEISRYIKALTERTKRLVDAMDMEYSVQVHEDEKYFQFLREVQKVVGRKCLFLKNENTDLIFQSQNNERLFYRREKTASIIETYLRKAYQGDDRDELLKQIPNQTNLTLNQQALEEFERYLNDTLPAFEKEMYDRITVESSKERSVAIFLHEKTGDKVDLNLTSAGRRWYFTYYFMKSTLEKGDLFIIDEPAGMLHPAAQKEVLADLMDLAQKGVQVVYSTHSPYLIPSEWNCVQFVSMGENGTTVSALQEKELNEAIRKVVGGDVFSLEEIVDAYNSPENCQHPEEMSERCYEALKKKYKTNEEIANALDVSITTVKNWHSKRKCISLEHLLKTYALTNTSVFQLLKGDV